MNKTLLTALAIGSLASAVPAATILTDSFTYPNGAIVGAPGSPWTNHSGAVGTALILSNRLELVSSRAEDISTPLSGQPYTTNGSTSLYASFDLTCTALPNVAGAYFAHFKDITTGGFRGRLFATATNAAAGNFRLAIANSNGSVAIGIVWPHDLQTNATYKVVMKYSPSNGVDSTLWVNPLVESDTNVVASDPNLGLLDIRQFAFRQVSAAGYGTLYIDNLKVGTAFTDVAGADQAPSISIIQTQNIPANGTTGALPITIGDDVTAASNLILSAASSNPTLIPTGNIVFGGSDSNRTVTVTPVAALEGESTITLTVTDGALNTANTAFLVRVGAPTISDIPNQITYANTPVIGVPFTIGDAETAASNLIVSATSANTNLIALGDIIFGGTGANRTIALVPQTDATGFSVITVRVTDGNTTNSDAFVATVAPRLGLLTNTYFNIADGPLVDGSGNWLSTSGTFQQVQVSNGIVSLTGAQDEDVAAALAGGPFAATNGAVLYASFKVLFTELPSGSGNYFAHFSDDGTTFRSRVFAMTNGAVPGGFRLGIANGGTAATPPHPAELALSNRYSVVIRYNTSTAQSWLWIDPAGESDYNVAATDNTSASTIHRFGLRQSAGIGAMQIDDLRIGGSYAEVAPYIPLTPAVNGETVTLTWPSLYSNYQAQATATLTNLNWTNLPDPVVSGSTNTITLTNASPTATYRLIVK